MSLWQSTQVCNWQNEGQQNKWATLTRPVIAADVSDSVLYRGQTPAIFRLRLGNTDEESVDVKSHHAASDLYKTQDVIETNVWEERIKRSCSGSGKTARSFTIKNECLVGEEKLIFWKDYKVKG